MTKELIDVEKLASNLVGRAEDDAKAVAAAIEAAPAPADKNSDDAWAEARRLAEAARADADALLAGPRLRKKTPSRRRVAAAAKPRDETLAEIESAAVAVEERRAKRQLLWQKLQNNSPPPKKPHPSSRRS